MAADAGEADLRGAVYWGYRLLLGREPESSLNVDKYLETMSVKTVEAVRRRILNSAEYLENFGDERLRRHARLNSISKEFEDRSSYARENGFFRDCFGIKTRVVYLPKSYLKYSGGLAGDFGKAQMPIHDDVEMIGMLEGLAACSRQIVVMELGAGWGPWITLGAQIARRKGLPYRLIGVEALDRIFQFMKTHLQDNGIEPERCALYRGAVGPTDVAAGPDQNDDDFDSIGRFSITTLLKGEPVVDVLHCDIQGLEAVSMEAAIDDVTRRVRRVIVGTHGRAIEEHLFHLFSSHGWILSDELPCAFQVKDGKIELHQDGTQVWLNRSTELNED